MNIKYFCVVLAIFLLAISTVCAAENITNNESVLSTVECADNLSISSEVVSVDGGNDDCLSVSNEYDVLNASSDVVSVDGGNDDCLSVSNEYDVLNASSDVVSVDGGNDDCLSVYSDEFSVSMVSNGSVAFPVESKLSVSNNQPIISVSVNKENSKLTSIYDKVYSTKKWKTIGLGSLKLKYKWSKKKMNKVSKKKSKIINKRLKRIMKKYEKKGWHYDRVFYNYNYGKYSAKFRYYVQFYKTVYYNGYGDVLYIC